MDRVENFLPTKQGLTFLGWRILQSLLLIASYIPDDGQAPSAMPGIVGPIIKKDHECLLLRLKPKKLEKELECENGKWSSLSVGCRE